MNSKMQKCLDDMKKLLEENHDDFLNYLKECKEKRYENKGQTIKEFLETGIMYDHNLKDLHELKGKTLGCFCKPKRCHGDILVELVSGLGE